MNKQKMQVEGAVAGRVRAEVGEGAGLRAAPSAPPPPIGGG
ncbi:MAG TPA: hypothetical protein VG226_13620 [Acidimicrobiales bacterium]|nr:hypothetical protein [Acidimicrobiales bacterium]